MHWDLLIDDTVGKALRHIPKKDAERLLTVIEELVVNPYAGDIEKMQGEKDVWRRRIGSYRVLYEIRVVRQCIYVFDVKRRTSNTY